MSGKINFLEIVSWLFGVLVLAIGFVNTFWGNDPFFGLFLVGVAFLYFPPVTAFIKAKTNFTVPRLLKIGLGIFVVWAALGVGELFEKIEMMRADF
jgi:hypothetical protein